MPAILVYIACSLDGYITAPEHGLAWLTMYDSAEEDYGYKALYDSVDTILMGSTTYEQILLLGAWPYRGKPTWVFSHRQIAVEQPDVRLTTAAPEAVVNEMAQHGVKRAWMVGGGKMIAAFREKGLISEYIITVIPIILGVGIPLFVAPGPCESLRLAESRTYANGLVQMRHIRLT